MARQKAYLGRLTITNAGGANAASNILAARELAFATGLMFFNDAAAYTGAIAVQVAPKEDSAAGAFQALSNNGTAITLTSNTAQKVDAGGFEAIRIKTNSTEVADRNVDVYALLDISGD